MVLIIILSQKAKQYSHSYSINFFIEKSFLHQIHETKLTLVDRDPILERLLLFRSYKLSPRSSCRKIKASIFFFYASTYPLLLFYPLIQKGQFHLLDAAFHFNQEIKRDIVSLAREVF